MQEEAVSSAFSELLAKKIVMVTGKGGIGKTLVSSALALEAHKLGKKVCLVESSANDQIAPLFGSPPIGHNLKELTPGVSVINLNSQENFKDFVIKHLGFAKLFEMVFTKPIVRSFIQMIPGIAELTLLGRLFYFIELDKENNFDIVIFDAFASGHFHSLMKTPDAVLNSGMSGPIIDETMRVRDFLADPAKVGIALVTVLEELVISEAIDFTKKLGKDSPAKLTALIANRTWPALPPGVSGTEGPDSQAGVPEAARPALDYWVRQRRTQEANLVKLQEGVRAIDPQLPIWTLEERGAFAEPVDVKQLQAWVEEAKRV